MTPETFRSIRRIFSFSFSSALRRRSSSLLACSSSFLARRSSCSSCRILACSRRLAASSLDSSRMRLPPFFILFIKDFSVSSIRQTTQQRNTTSTVPTTPR